MRPPRLGIVLVLVVVLASLIQAVPPSVYNVQLETKPTYVRFTWQSNVDATSEVRYGIGNLDMYKRSNLYTTSHSILLIGLQDRAEYQYQPVSCVSA